MLKKMALFSSLFICNVALNLESLHASNRPLLIVGCVEDVYSGMYFKSPEDVETYINKHPEIDGIGLIHMEKPPEWFSLLFLNNHPHIQHLTLSGKAAEPAVFHLSELKHITHFINDIQTTRWHRFGHMPGLVEMDTRMEHFPYLGGMPNLKKLSLRGNPAPNGVATPINLSALENYSALRCLHIGEIGKIDLSPVGTLTTLEELSVAGGVSLKIKDYSFLRRLSNLEVFKVNQDHRFSVGTYQEFPGHPVARFEKTDVLFLNTKLESGFLDLFPALPKLRSLSFNMVEGINTLHYLRYCKNLQSLEMAYSCTDMLDALAGLPLKVLDISYGSTVDLYGLAEISTLEILNVEGKYGRMWKALAAHPSLRRIKASVEGIMADKVYIDLEINLFARVGKRSFFEDLKTIPNLEMLCIQTSGVPEEALIEYKTQLADFQQARPDVVVGYFEDWQTVILRK
ncbi:MAG: hypothetical protein KBB83_05190 [Alphaproteobacteria bacterium]|nr:hypothetical protein [Alphaproteobacteria bacterium]